MGILSEQDIIEIYEAAVTMRLVESRTALMAGTRPDFVATLPSATNQAAQTLSDLHALNEIESLADGSCPLSTWLLNATALAGPRKEAWILKAFLNENPPLGVLTVAKALERRQFAWKELPRDRTDRLATYFDSIARCLVDLVAHLSAKSPIDRQRRIDKCSELGVYANRFLLAVGDTFTEMEAHALSDTLTKACHYRRIASELAGSPGDEGRKRAIDRLAEAAGSFRGLAATLRV
jgi:hypothetical protein